MCFLKTLLSYQPKNHRATRNLPREHFLIFLQIVAHPTTNPKNPTFSRSMSLVLVACALLLCNSSCSSRHLSCQLTALLPASMACSNPTAAEDADGDDDVARASLPTTIRRGRSRGLEGVECEARVSSLSLLSGSKIWLRRRGAGSLALSSAITSHAHFQ